MSRNNNGLVYVETLLCLLIIFSFVELIRSMTFLLGKIQNERMEYSVKQQFYLNKLLIESGEEPLQCDLCEIYLNNGLLCIEWVDLDKNEKQYCEIIQLE